MAVGKLHGFALARLGAPQTEIVWGLNCSMTQGKSSLRINRNRTRIGNIAANGSKWRPELPKIGRNRPKIGKIYRKIAEAAPDPADVAQSWSHSWQNWRLRPGMVQFAPTSPGSHDFGSDVMQKFSSAPLHKGRPPKA